MNKITMTLNVDHLIKEALQDWMYFAEYLRSWMKM